MFAIGGRSPHNAGWTVQANHNLWSSTNPRLAWLWFSCIAAMFKWEGFAALEVIFGLLLKPHVSPLSFQALEMTRGCASVQSAERVFPLTLLLYWPTSSLLALFPRQPIFDESFNLMLLRLYGFGFCISLAYNNQDFFPCELTACWATS